jgi:tRNA pseudouridine55 synthase
MAGIATDSYDLLGVITEFMKHCDRKQSETALRRVIPEFVGSQTQKYPPYSAARLRGKPLYWYSRRGILKNEDIPSHRITVSHLRLGGSYIYLISERRSSQESVQYAVISVRI